MGLPQEPHNHSIFDHYKCVSQSFPHKHTHSENHQNQAENQNSHGMRDRGNHRTFHIPSFSSLCFSLCVQMVYRLSSLVFFSCLITGHREGNSFLYCAFSVSCFRLLEEREPLCSIPKRLIGYVCACLFKHKHLHHFFFFLTSSLLCFSNILLPLPNCCSLSPSTIPCAPLSIFVSFSSVSISVTLY